MYTKLTLHGKTRFCSLCLTMIFLKLGPLYDCCASKLTFFTAAFISTFFITYFGMDCFFFSVKTRYCTAHDKTCWQQLDGTVPSFPHWTFFIGTKGESNAHCITNTYRASSTYTVIQSICYYSHWRFRIVVGFAACTPTP